MAQDAKETGAGSGEFEAKPQGKRDFRRPDFSATVGKLMDKLPPHSLEAEVALLGAMVIDSQVIGEVLMIVKTPDEFYDPKHGAIYRAIIELYDKHNVQELDVVSLLELLKTHGALELVGGIDYLSQVVESTPGAAGALHYAKIVHEKYKLRKLIAISGELLFDAYHSGEFGPEGSNGALESAEQRIFQITQEWQTGDIEPLSKLLKREMDRIDQSDRASITGYRTHYAELDGMLSGLQPGELLIIAARPSMGKTAVAMNIAEQIALGGTPWNPGSGPQVPVAVFSLEMSKASVSLRLLSARSGVNAHELRTGGLDDDTYERVFQAYQELSKAKIFIDDSPSLSVTALRARARRLVRQHDVKVIVIDYLQLLTAPAQGKESRQVEVSAISRGIKALARELNVPIICLSQLNRASEQREGNRPRMSDLRESGSIEQDADVIMLLHREEYYHVQDPSWAEENQDKVGTAELIIAKQRNGPVGVVSLTWDNRTTRFKNHDPHARAPIDYEKYAQSAAPPWDAPNANGNTPAPAPAPNKFGAGGFIAKDKSGPVENFRDGGGPEDDFGV